MTSDELDTYQPARSADLTVARPDTDDWYSSFPNIVKLAEYVAGTEFVPEPMRNHPAAIAGAILTGREMGLPPMVSLRHLFVVRGRVGQSAELMRAQVFRAGHQIRDIEVSPTRVIVEGRRDDEREWTRVQYTIEDAHRDQIDVRRFPADKLYARATSRLARRKFPDAVMGLPTVDELEDGAEPGAVVELADAPPVQRKRQTRKPKAAATQPPPAKGDRFYGTDDDLLDDDTSPGAGGSGTGDNVRHTDAGPPPAPAPTEIETAEATFADLIDEPPTPEPPATKKQRGMMFALFAEIGVTSHDDRITIAADILGYPITTTGDFTSRETNQIITKIQQWQAEHTPGQIADHVNDVLNIAALREAAQQEPQP